MIAEADYDSMDDLSEDLHRDYECWSSDEELDVVGDLSGVLRGLEGDGGLLSPPTPSKSQYRTRSALSYATSIRARQKLKKEGNPTLAVIYFVIYCFLKTMTYVTVSMLYNRMDKLDPPNGIGPFPMLFMRSVMGVGMMSIQLNRHIKKETWDTIDRPSFWPLVIKTFCGVTTNIIQYSTSKYIPSTII